MSVSNGKGRASTVGLAASSDSISSNCAFNVACSAAFVISVARICSEYPTHVSVILTAAAMLQNLPARPPPPQQQSGQFHPSSPAHYNHQLLIFLQMPRKIVFQAHCWHHMNPPKRSHGGLAQHSGSRGAPAWPHKYLEVCIQRCIMLIQSTFGILYWKMRLKQT